jgi:hypothetical protein
MNNVVNIENKDEDISQMLRDERRLFDPCFHSDVIHVRILNMFVILSCLE